MDAIAMRIGRKTQVVVFRIAGGTIEAVFGFIAATRRVINTAASRDSGWICFKNPAMPDAEGDDIAFGRRVFKKTAERACEGPE